MFSKNELFLRLFGAFLRHFLGFAGSVLVAKGFLSEDAVSTLTSEAVLGAIILLVSTGLSFVDKVKTPPLHPKQNVPPPEPYIPPPVQQLPMESYPEWANRQIDDAGQRLISQAPPQTRYKS